MKCKNQKCSIELNKKQKNFCSQSCHYDWKRNEKSSYADKRNELNNLKKYAASLTDINEIYNFISNNIFKFNCITNLKESERILKMINEYSLNISNSVSINSWKDLYDYLKGVHLCSNIDCTKDSKFSSFTHGYKEFCSNGCLYKWRSYNMEGDKNNFHKVSKETRDRIGKENGQRIKKMIAEGTFTPNITNSWAKSRCIISLEGKDIKLRSSWEAYFQLYNPKCKYEKLRIPYNYKNEWRNYIVDFIDTENKIIYEIKPNTESNNTINSIKRESAIQWANFNNYIYIEINDDWFKCNYNESLLEGQHDENRLKRLLFQFNENK